jgi:hypothetical protein
MKGGGLSAEIVPFRRGRCEGRRSVVCGNGLFNASETPEQVSAGGVKGVVVGHVQLLDEVQGRFWPVDFADGDGPVQRDHGRRRDGQELVIENENLPPVG